MATAGALAIGPEGGHQAGCISPRRGGIEGQSNRACCSSRLVHHASAMVEHQGHATTGLLGLGPEIGELLFSISHALS